MPVMSKRRQRIENAIGWGVIVIFYLVEAIGELLGKLPGFSSSYVILFIAIPLGWTLAHLNMYLIWRPLRAELFHALTHLYEVPLKKVLFWVGCLGFAFFNWFIMLQSPAVLRPMQYRALAVLTLLIAGSGLVIPRFWARKLRRE